MNISNFKTFIHFLQFKQNTHTNPDFELIFLSDENSQSSAPPQYPTSTTAGSAFSSNQQGSNDYFSSNQLGPSVQISSNLLGPSVRFSTNQVTPSVQIVHTTQPQLGFYPSTTICSNCRANVTTL